MARLLHYHHLLYVLQYHVAIQVVHGDGMKWKERCTYRNNIGTTKPSRQLNGVSLLQSRNKKITMTHFQSANYTIHKLLNYIEDEVLDRVDIQTANKTIMQALMKRAYVPDTDGPVKFFRLMEHDVYRIHILKFAYRWDTLIVHYQTTIRDSNRHNGINLHIIEDEWVRREPVYTSSFNELEL
jgi:hypothetical protein